ncbi:MULTISPECIES: cbb3-type cytochrome c oxidase subunit 3 [Gammaproteobacteria]|uniref:cbb3-type cytochrome oxidase subunit 3 n=1 Tax=Gammaproteobacteria TaxID=1236 RepID=UPI000DCFF30B|nr:MULTISPECIES: cbb3-type cytochrome c oxidase subunit 3 [Gammaproteobacteria]RTE87241.1 cbb3-type cytochrome c oxidase subunit 3 [Aliidiomarina sp. B3213]TCZ92972.1 cbb3-type cytochrome c oxidase subunit 3 [Lysobacter sp. N42]
MSGASFNAWYTLVVFGIIILVCVWAFLPRNKSKFDDIAKSVIEDEKSGSSEEDSKSPKRESKKDE